jgi:hypothetical protein
LRAEGKNTYAIMAKKPESKEDYLERALRESEERNARLAIEMEEERGRRRVQLAELEAEQMRLKTLLVQQQIDDLKRELATVNGPQQARSPQDQIAQGQQPTPAIPPERGRSTEGSD